MTPAERHAAVIARLDELEQLARSASTETGDTVWLVDSGSYGGPDICGEHGGTIVYNEGTLTDAIAGHIVAHQPRSALTLITGRRRILERHAPEVHQGKTLPFCEYHGQTRTTAWPCDDYRDAAADLLPPDDQG